MPILPPDVVERIKRFAPEHKQRFNKVLDAVVYSNGKPNMCDAISLSKNVAIEDEPFPYVVSPMDEEAWIWTDGIRAKKILRRAEIDFDCCVDEHEDIVDAIVRHPTLESLHFGENARFIPEVFRALFARVRNLKELVVGQRIIASPITDPDVMDQVFARMMHQSKDTLHTLRITIRICKRVCTALPFMSHLKNLQLHRCVIQYDIPDLRGLSNLHTVSIRYVDRMHEVVRMLPASIKSLHLECILHQGKVDSTMYDVMSDFITTHGQLETFRIYTQFFNDELFFEKMYPAIASAHHIHSFSIYGPETLRSLYVPGFERNCRRSSRHDVMAGFGRSELL